jgi:N-acetylneuraminic acid mutarotase
VLVAGGSDSNSPCSCTTFRSEVDLYDADSDTWEATGALITARYDHTATRLPNGMILVAGGFGGLPDPLHTGGAPLNSVELYDPSTGTWSAAAAMTVARTQHTATLLASGRVLVTGGTDGTTTHASAELYDPATDTWSPAASMAVERHSHSALDLGNGKVLVVGGFNASSSPVFGVAGGELYDPITNTWISSGSMAIPRQKFSAISLGGGRVLIVGGEPNYEGVPEFYE